MKNKTTDSTLTVLPRKQTLEFLFESMYQNSKLTLFFFILISQSKIFRLSTANCLFR